MPATLDFVIATTAAPPWFTGTAVNPVHRARELSRRGARVQLWLPFIPREEQGHVFPPGLEFADPDAHAAWMRERYGLAEGELAFYPARYHREHASIFPERALAPQLPACATLLLEEPDHLPVRQPWSRLRGSRFGRTIGVLHTNYRYYLQLGMDRLRARASDGYLRWIARRNTHGLIKLSRAIEGYPEAAISNVNGVATPYFAAPPAATSGCYFIGKLIAAKGLSELVDGWRNAAPGELLTLFGSGDQGSERDVIARAARIGARVEVRPPIERPWEVLRPFRAFINCSQSEVLCTTTAEALAMGKWAVVPRHPSNDFFAQFPSCLMYSTRDELRKSIARALAEAPPPCDLRPLSWASATDRLLAVSATFGPTGRATVQPTAPVVT